MDAGTLVIISVYYRYISKEWLPLQIFGVVMTFASAIALYIVPESPKYLYSKGESEQCRKALKFIARFNGKREEFKVRFDKEVREGNEEVEKPGKISELIKDKVHRRNLMIFIALWITGVYTYYNIYF